MIKTAIYELNQPQGNDTVDIEMLNENARKIDNILNFKLDNSKRSDSISSDSSDSIATSKAVKVAYDKGVEALGVASRNDSSLADITTNNTRLTTDKTLNGAINELFTNANNGKQNWVDVIGSPLVNTDTFSTLKSKTQTIKDTMATNLTSKGQNSVNAESLTLLATKIGQIPNVTANPATPSGGSDGDYWIQP